MPWASHGPEAGFTTGKPWLPIPDEPSRACGRPCRSRDPGSTLSTTRAFLDWRRERQPLTRGAHPLPGAPGAVLAFERARTTAGGCCACSTSAARAGATGPREPSLDAGFYAATGADARRPAASTCRPWLAAFAAI